jgi:hypothetical protein
MISGIYCTCRLDFSSSSLNKIDSLDNLTYPLCYKYFLDGQNRASYILKKKYLNEGMIGIDAGYNYVEEHYSPDQWLVDFVFENYQKLKLLNLESMGFTFTYDWLDEFKIKLPPDTMRKIAQMNAYLCVSC